SADASRNLDFKQGESVFFAIVGGTALAFYSMIGFEDSVNVAEETKQPRRTCPRALFVGLGIAGVIYLFVTLTASAVVPTDALAGSSAPLLEVVERGPLSISTDVFSAIALLAVANGALINMIMASRIVYGMAEQGIVSRTFGGILPGRRTPWVAIAFTTALAVVLISTGDLSTLADTTVLLLLMVFTIVNVAVLYLRRDRVEHDHFRAPAVLPILGAVVSAALIVDSVSGDPAVALRALALLGCGLVLCLLNHLVYRGERGGELEAERLTGELRQPQLRPDAAVVRRPEPFRAAVLRVVADDAGLQHLQLRLGQ